MSLTVSFMLLLSVILGSYGGEVEPLEYIIKQSAETAIDDCKSVKGDYYLCPTSSILLDSKHGPKNYSHAALNRFYTKLTENERTLFKFPSEVHLEVVQMYYYAESLGNSSRRVILTFYSVDDRYVPRLPIPGGTKQLGFTSAINISRTFDSICFTLASDVKNLLMASTFTEVDMRISEVNFFSSQVSDEICKGEYLVLPTEECTDVLDENCQEQLPGTPGPNSTVLYETEEEALHMARCYAACLWDTNVVNISSKGSAWPSVGISELPCGKESISNALECTRGCFIQAQDTEQSTDRCEDACVMECESNQFATYRGSSCPLMCQESACRRGCLLYKDKIEGRASTMVDPPSSRPKLNRQVDSIEAGIFTIDYPVPPSSVNSNSFVTAFVFRVQSAESQHYIMLSSLEEDLDLGEFACQEVSIAFTVVAASSNDSSLVSDGTGSSAVPIYSPEQPRVCVHGDSYPTQFLTASNSVRWNGSVLEDLREDFRGSARAQFALTWRLPEDLDRVSHYEIVLDTALGGASNCGPDSKSYIVENKDTTELLLTADSVDDSPGFGAFPKFCNYGYDFIIHPLRRGDRPFTGFLNEFQQDNVYKQEWDLSCSREVNTTSGHIGYMFKWTLGPPDLPYDLAEAFVELTLIINEVTLPRQGAAIMVDTFYAFEFGQREASFNFSQEPAVVTLERNISGSLWLREATPRFIPGMDTRFQIQFKIVWQPNLTFFYRDIPRDVNCLVNSNPLPSEPIDIAGIRIINFDLTRQSRLFMNLEWAVPGATYGPVKRFEYRVTSQPLEPFYAENPGRLTVLPQDTVPGSSPSLVLNDVVARGVTDNTLCVFFQVRVFNSFLMSNWSRPFPIPRNSSINSSDCSMLQFSPLAPEEVTTPFWPYVLVAAIMFAVILLVVGIPVGVILCKNHRLKSNLSHIVKQQGAQVFFGDYDRNFDLGHLPLDQWEIPRDDITLHEEIGRGFFGTVYKGSVTKLPTDHQQGQNGPEYTVKTVAVKMLKARPSPSEKLEFLEEIEITKKIAERKDLNVVTMIGCVLTSEPLSLVTEYMPYGCLRKYLLDIRSIMMQEYRRLRNSPYNSSSGYAGLRLSSAFSQSQYAAASTLRGNSPGQLQTHAILNFSSSLPHNSQPPPHSLLGVTPSLPSHIIQWQQPHSDTSSLADHQPPPRDSLTISCGLPSLEPQQKFIQSHALLKVSNSLPGQSQSEKPHGELGNRTTQHQQKRHTMLSEIPSAETATDQSQLEQQLHSLVIPRLSSDSLPNQPTQQQLQHLHNLLSVTPSSDSLPGQLPQRNTVISITPSSTSSYAKLGQIEAIHFLSFAHQIASGMEYLSSINVVHRDLACRNVLVGHDKVLKITDFGLSRCVTDENPAYVRTSNRNLPMKWMALESIRDRQFTVASDVWMYGVTLWEIATLCRPPYPEIDSWQELETRLETGERLSRPRNCRQEFYQVMLNCWEADPSNRPSFTQLKADMLELQENNNSSHFIQFPGPEMLLEEEPDSYITASPFMSPVRGNSPIPEEESPPFTPIEDGNPSGQGNLLVVEGRRRRHLSAPIEGSEWNEDSEPSEYGGSRRRSHTNTYVRTPKRDSKTHIRRSFEWLVDPPAMTAAPPIITIQTEEESN